MRAIGPGVEEVEVWMLRGVKEVEWVECWVGHHSLNRIHQVAWWVV
jgi:hypothetical protein